ncbi:MAG TPA: tetratricopeptide repeat protein, partial [Thermoanaerobaculia bacterium]|nr:tetratricopeptide repeat protein [Thermoanaerobaculia bacterium]
MAANEKFAAPTPDHRLPPPQTMGRKAREKLSRIAAEPRLAAVSDTAPPLTGDWGKREWTIVALLFGITMAVFGQVVSHAFINFDDGQLISENQHVLHGDVAWALTSAEIGWYPLTWLSHMLDVALWGQRAGMHLLTGVFLHAVSAILLFLALRRLTGTTWPPAFVAALFAIHPMHVESVAWASERKDTLSTLLAMLALWLYARAPRRMLGVSIALALSLMAKQMYVTLPFVFLLLDFWPGERIHTLDDLRRRAAEKWPLFALTVIGAAAAFVGQRNLKAVHTMASLPLAERVANALIAYLAYAGKLFVPTGMALPYPLTRVSLSEAVVPLVVLAAITIAAVAARRTAPYLVTGWLWFLGTLVPVIGIVAIGNESMADRYTYFSYIGLFIAIVFGAVDLARRLRIPDSALAAAGAITVAVFAIVAMNQTRYWKDSETLFTHALAVTRDNAVAEYNLGQALQATKPDAALPHLRQAIALVQPLLQAKGSTAPDWYPQAYVGIGTAMLMKARPMPQSPARNALIRGAITNYRQALTIDPNAAHARNNIAVATQMMPHTLAAALESDYDDYLNNGTVFSQQGRYEEAVEEFRRAVDLSPQSIEAHIYLGLGLLQAKR